MGAKLKFWPYTPYNVCQRCGANKDKVVDIHRILCRPNRSKRFGCNCAPDDPEHIHMECHSCGHTWLMEVDSVADSKLR